MKITKQQREKVIKEIMKQVKEANMWDIFLCMAFSRKLNETIDGTYNVSPRMIQKYIPRFKQSTAKKYFKANGHFAWWGLGKKKNRIQCLKFLRYLLTGKLPIKRKKK